MKKRVHTVLCWILAMSLTWLPLAVSADFSPPFTENNSCHDMNSAMSSHNMSSVMNDQVAVSNNSMHESMMQKEKGYCDNCESNCATCIGMTSCGQNSNHFSAFIIFNKDILQSQNISQASIEHIVQYHNQIISPDFRPPII